MNSYYFLLLTLVLSSYCYADSVHNKDVQTFVEQAELCDFLAGEFDSSLSKAEQHRIELSIDHNCGQAKKVLPKLLKKYQHDAAVTKLLKKHAPSVSDYNSAP